MVNNRVVGIFVVISNLLKVQLFWTESPPGCWTYELETSSFKHIQMWA